MTEDTTTPAPSEPVAGPVQRKLGQAAEARWYCLDRDGVAMLCKDKADAQAQAVENDDCWPGRAPHRAVLLGDVTGLHAELRHARDGLTKGRARMREDNERLRAALAKIEAGCCIDPRTVAREALWPNVGAKAPAEARSAGEGRP